MTHLLIPTSNKDHFQGSLDSTITLVEYGDYQCPYCRLAYPVVKQVQKELGKELCFVFRNFPLRQAHPFAMMAAEAAEAAALQNKFWDIHDLIYENQPLLSPDLIAELAEELDLDLKKLKSDMKSAEILKKIEEDFKTGIRSGVNGTPCFFINEERYEGAPAVRDLVKTIREKQGF